MTGLPDHVRWNGFAAPDDLAEALAGHVADALRAAVKERGAASLAVSGGSTPARFLEALSRCALDWDKVVVTLVDERFVPPSSARSNEKLVRGKLLVNAARLARFVSLYHTADTAEGAAGRAQAGLALMPRPLDIVVLGMGTDGHTASLFPDADGLDALLDPDARDLVMPVHAQSAGEERLTLPLARIVEARLLILHIEGAEKRSVFETAMASGAKEPVSAVVSARAPLKLDVYWAP